MPQLEPKILEDVGPEEYSITRVIQGAAQIPFPVDDDVMTVEQAVGTFIAWPRNLLREVKANGDRVKSGAVKVLMCIYIYIYIYIYSTLIN